MDISPAQEGPQPTPEEEEGRAFLERVRADPSSCRVAVEEFPSFHRAIFNGADYRVVRKLLKKRNALENAQEKHMGMTALDVAVGCGRADVAQQLIRAFGGQALMNESASRPFLLALEAGCGKSLLLLLEESGGVGEVEVKSALHRIRAVRNSSNMLAFIKALVERGADLNSLGRFDTPSGTIMTTPLCRTVILNMVNYVTVLVKAGANVNQVDGEGHTALHYSVMGGLVMMTCLLVDRGAKVGTRQV